MACLLIRGYDTEIRSEGHHAIFITFDETAHFVGGKLGKMVISYMVMVTRIHPISGSKPTANRSENERHGRSII